MDTHLGYYIFPYIPEASKKMVNLYASMNDKCWSNTRKNKPFMKMHEFSNKEVPDPYMDLADFTFAMAAQYLESNVIEFYSARATKTEPISSSILTSSQLYHRDWEDDSNVKVFVLLGDVEKKHGPFAFIDVVGSQKVTNAMGYVNDRSHRKTDKEVYDIYDGDPIALTGKAGTTIMIDTCRCFHYGGRTLEDNRQLALIQFLKLGHRGASSAIKTYSIIV